MNQPWAHMCSPSRTPLRPPSPSHPPGSSQCTSLSTLSHASTLDRQSVSHMIIYTFQCYPPNQFQWTKSKESTYSVPLDSPGEQFINLPFSACGLQFFHSSIFKTQQCIISAPIITSPSPLISCLPLKMTL